MNAPPRSAWDKAFDAWRRRPGEQLSLEDAPADARPAELADLETQRETADRLGWTADGQVEEGEWHPTEGWVN
jgi:hypothetical protein